MKYLFVLLLLSMLVGASAQADWDPVMEAQEQAAEEARQREEQEKKREIQKRLNEAQTKVDEAHMDEKRQTLGAAAQGKSDAEVNRLYDAKIKNDTDAAYRSAETARNALSQGEGAAAVQQVTGKSLQELENMSEAEAEAFSREMEEKYGK